ncbi:glutaredoxin [bacterium]|nr:glutaredoxin [bacterium]
MNIEIYSKDHCPFCDMAVHKAQAMMQESSDIKTAVYKLGLDFDRDEMMAKFPTARTFPQIKIDGKSIGGWDQFKDIV